MVLGKTLHDKEGRLSKAVETTISTTLVDSNIDHDNW